MKHLKRYNEELLPSTYKKAGDKLKHLGHTKRGENLVDWGELIQKREKDRNTKKRIEESSKLGIYKMKIIEDVTEITKSGVTTVKPRKIVLEGNFFLHFFLDTNVFKEDYRAWHEEGRSLVLTFGLGIIPSDEETKNNLLNFIDENELHLGTCFMNWMYLHLSDNDGRYDVYCDHDDKEAPSDDPILKPNGDLTFEGAERDVAYFGDRKSAVKFKKTLIDIFEGRIVYGETNENPGGIKEIVMDELCSENDRTLEEFESIIKSLRKININKLYKD